MRLRDQLLGRIRRANLCPDRVSLGPRNMAAPAGRAPVPEDDRETLIANTRPVRSFGLSCASAAAGEARCPWRTLPFVRRRVRTLAAWLRNRAIIREALRACRRRNTCGRAGLLWRMALRVPTLRALIYSNVSRQPVPSERRYRLPILDRRFRLRRKDREPGCHLAAYLNQNVQEPVC